MAVWMIRLHIKQLFDIKIIYTKPECFLRCFKLNRLVLFPYYTLIFICFLLLEFIFFVFDTKVCSNLSKCTHWQRMRKILRNSRDNRW